KAEQAATAFARICAEGAAQLLYDAHLLVNEAVDAWEPAMRKVAKLPSVSPEIQNAFLPIWIESKMLPLSVGSRPILAKALRVLMPGGYTGPALVLYRGATHSERCRHRYGFSWSIDAAVARGFAQRARGREGVVLR